MFPKTLRLTKKQDFQTVLQKGKILQGKFIGLAFYPFENIPGPKIGIIVSNKISKRAVVRNKIKRILREATKKWQVLVPQNMYFILLAKKSAKNLTLKEAEAEVGGLLEKINA